METVVGSVSTVTAQTLSKLLRRYPSKEEFGEGLQEDKEGATMGLLIGSSSSLLGLTYLHTRWRGGWECPEYHPTPWAIPPANQLMKSLVHSLTS